MVMSGNGMSGTVYETNRSRASIGMKSTTNYNPALMTGSLNGMFRKKEMKRINNGNRRILQQLREVKPSVGTFNDWKKHENRINILKKKISN